MTDNKTIIVQLDETSVNWMPDPDAIELFLRGVRNHMTNILAIRGHVFVNDILDELHMHRLRAGQIRGWVRNADNPHHYVDMSWTRNGGTWVIVFNTEGDILERALA